MFNKGVKGVIYGVSRDPDMVETFCCIQNFDISFLKKRDLTKNKFGKFVFFSRIFCSINTVFLKKGCKEIEKNFNKISSMVKFDVTDGGSI